VHDMNELEIKETTKLLLKKVGDSSDVIRLYAYEALNKIVLKY